MDKFNCNACGTCCTKLDGSELYKKLDRGDGTCIYFEEESRLCKIYEERPLICRVDEMYEEYFKDEYSKEEYYELNYNLCQKWQSKK